MAGIVDAAKEKMKEYLGITDTPPTTEPAGLSNAIGSGARSEEVIAPKNEGKTPAPPPVGFERQYNE